MHTDPSIFISTPFRSGSALLSRTLNAHSKVSLINDQLKYFSFCYQKYLPLSDQNVEIMLSDVASRMLARFNIKVNVDDCVKSIDRPLSDTTIYSSLLNHILAEQRKELIGEMESISWTKIPIFLNMFPNSKALLIVRDLRDVVVSFKKKP